MRTLCVAALSLLLPLVATAQNPQTRQGFGISFGFGPGSAAIGCTGCSTDRTNGSIGYLRLGGHVRPNVLVGGELNSWGHSEGGSDETVGYAVFVVQWYPMVERGLYLKGGFGLSLYLVRAGSDEVRSQAPAFTVGAGYDIRVGRNFSLTPFANYLGSGKGELEFNGASTGVKISTSDLQFGLGFTWH